MTDSPLKMTCEDIGRKLKDFIGDLLAESDYQAFVDHLEDCPKCTNYVRGMGSFSNQLWELGEMKVPFDLDSTILFQLKKAEDAHKPKKGFPKKRIFGVIVVIVGLFIAFGRTKFFKNSGHPPEGDAAGHSLVNDAVIIQAPSLKKQVSDAEAERLFHQLHTMAKSLELIAGAKDKKETPEEKTSKEEGTSFSDEQLKAKDVFIPDSYALHWHIPYLGETKMKQFLNTMKTLAIDLDYEDQDFLIFTTVGKKLKLLSEGIQFTSQVYLDLPEFILNDNDPNKGIPASIYFEGRSPSTAGDSGPDTNLRSGALISVERKTPTGSHTFEWHVLLVTSRQDTLLDVIRRGGGTVHYTSKEAVVFSIPEIGLQALADKMQRLGGIFVDFGNMELGEGLSLRGTANVMIYFSKQ